VEAAAHLQRGLCSVPGDQFAADVHGGKYKDQGPEHAVRLFGVTMRTEQAACLVDQQLVQLADTFMPKQPSPATTVDMIWSNVFFQVLPPICTSAASS
jgi:hypothetical protein